MKQKVKIRFRDDFDIAVIQVRATSTARVLVDVLLTKDQVLGIAAWAKDKSFERFNEPMSWREV